MHPALQGPDGRLGGEGGKEPARSPPRGACHRTTQRPSEAAALGGLTPSCVSAQAWPRALSSQETEMGGHLRSEPNPCPPDRPWPLPSGLAAVGTGAERHPSGSRASGPPALSLSGRRDLWARLCTETLAHKDSGAGTAGGQRRWHSEGACSPTCARADRWHLSRHQAPALSSGTAPPVALNSMIRGSEARLDLRRQIISLALGGTQPLAMKGAEVVRLLSSFTCLLHMSRRGLLMPPYWQ